MTNSKCPDQHLRFGQIWINLYSFRPIWSHVKQFRPIWSYLELFVLFLFLPNIFYFSYFFLLPIFLSLPSFFITKILWWGKKIWIKKIIFCVKLFCGENKFWWKRCIMKFFPSCETFFYDYLSFKSSYIKTLVKKNVW